MFAMIFPGQGTQKIKMLAAISANYSIIKKTFDEASYYLNFNLWRLINDGPIEKLNLSMYAQPAILTASVSIFRLWKEKNGNNPAIAAGHSLGEYSALVCANVINFSDAIKLVHVRGKLMQKQCSKNIGSMQAIIGLNESQVQKKCIKYSINSVVSISNFNSNNQFVISGKKKAVQKVSEECKKMGAKVTNIAITVPAHSILMKSISNEFCKVLSTISFNKPTFPVINNVHVRCRNSKNSICKALIKQLYYPVRWKESIDLIISKKIFLILELGPNNILTNLNNNRKKIQSVAINTPVNFLHTLKKTRK